MLGIDIDKSPLNTSLTCFLLISDAPFVVRIPLLFRTQQIVVMCTVTHAYGMQRPNAIHTSVVFVVIQSPLLGHMLLFKKIEIVQ